MYSSGFFQGKIKNGTELIKFLAAVQFYRQDDLKKWMNRKKDTEFCINLSTMVEMKSSSTHLDGVVHDDRVG